MVRIFLNSPVLPAANSRAWLSPARWGDCIQEKTKSRPRVRTGDSPPNGLILSGRIAVFYLSLDATAAQSMFLKKASM
jgi:hypothetical protein